MKRRLIILGAGGHARTVVAIARRMAVWDLIGVYDRQPPAQPESIDGVPIAGSFEQAAHLPASGVTHAALAVGDAAERAALLGRFSSLGFSFPILQHVDARVEDNVALGEGTVVCAGAILGAQVRVGRAAIINTGAILDHETVVGDFAHVAPGCRIAGRVRIGASAMIGIGSTIREKIAVGAGAVVGAGSVVVDDIPERVVAYGVPARVARTLEP